MFYWCCVFRRWLFVALGRIGRYLPYLPTALSRVRYKDGEYDERGGRVVYMTLVMCCKSTC